MGMSQAQFAEYVSATPAQMSIFLRGKGSLSTDSLNKSLDLVGVNLSLYSKRTNLAREVAEYLVSKNVSSIDNWTKSDLATFTQRKYISLFFDVQSEKEYEELEKSGIIDIESTFPYFKALVSYYMSLDKNYMSLDKKRPTASQANHALASLLGIAVVNIAAAMVGLAATSKQLGACSLFKKTSDLSVYKKALDFIQDSK